MNSLKILGGIFLGWSLGSNDAANVFGTAVASQMVRWSTAVVLIAIFAVAGALLEGEKGLKTLGGLTNQDINTAFCASMGAALTVTAMTIAKLPVSTSQAVVGAIVGIGILQNNVNFSGLTKVVICWIGTPIGAIIFSILFYPILAYLLRKLHPHFLFYDKLMRTLLIIGGIYGAYALGANNVANVTGVFYKAGILSSFQALLIGGMSIALGAMTFSKNVMITVGKKIIPLDAFSAFIVILSEAVTVHIYAVIGVPVSTSQAVVGGVLGIGILKGVRTISYNTIMRIFGGWFLTPIVGMLFSIILYRVFFP